MADAGPPNINDLRDSRRFEPILAIPHAAVAETLRPFLFCSSPVTWTYWAANILILAWIVALALRTETSFPQALPAVCVGMLATWMVMLPVHEHLHAWAYRRAGAVQVRVHYQLRTLTAHCLADGAVLGARDFASVCMAPLAGVNGSLLLLTLLPLPTPLMLGLLGGAAAAYGRGQRRYRPGQCAMDAPQSHDLDSR